MLFPMLLADQETFARDVVMIVTPGILAWVRRQMYNPVLQTGDKDLKGFNSC